MMVDRESWVQKTGLFDLVNHYAAPPSFGDPERGNGIISYL
jgi:hypothetical protein